ncbi:unnamed protein product [Meganyctiphanes norvegica]|uniref:MBD domain-containing protein n=1 Tax=Meganyctiphanes norvegica TaxID=48144 RepID=A0AAV2S9Q3_MEGNR
MNEMGFDKNCDDADEFECSECDFKCTSEIVIIQHSIIHQCHNSVNVDVLDISRNGTGIEDNSKEDDTVVNSQVKVSCEKEIVSHNRLEETPGIKDLGIYTLKVKQEPSSFEAIRTTEMHIKSEFGNRKIKLEGIDIDVKQEFFSQQINEYGNIHPDKDLGLMPTNIIPIDGKEEIQSAYNKVNLYTEDGILSAKTILDDPGSLSCKSEPSHNDMSITIDSQDLPPDKYKGPFARHSSIEVEVDNTGIYLPPGWKRKMFLRTTFNHGKVRYDCYYYTAYGKMLRSKKDAYRYAEKGGQKQFAGVDIAKLNFSIVKTPIKQDQPTLELDIDNAEVYIPEGWQRKIYMSTNSKGHKLNQIKYLNREGKRFGCKADVYLYLPHSDIIEETLIDVEKMDFSSLGTRSRLSFNKRCQSGQAQEKAVKKKYKKIGIEKDKSRRRLSLNKKCQSGQAQDKAVKKKYKEFGQIVDFVFEVRKTERHKLYLCKECKFSFSFKNAAYSHYIKHVHTFKLESISNSVLPNKYDYFVCTDCSIPILKRNNVQAHLQSHCIKQITSTIIGAKSIRIADSRVHKILYCCEICEFASFKYSLISEHIINHTLDEIVTADDDKYHKYKHELDENAPNSIYKKLDSDDNEQIIDNISDRKLDKQDIPDNKLSNGRTIKHRNALGKIEKKVDHSEKNVPKGLINKLYKYTQGQIHFTSKKKVK